MKKQISFFSTKHRLLKSLGRIMRDESGSILALVLVLCSALLIIMSMLITSVVATTDVNKNVDYSENAYLAARSGITMLAEAGADSSFAGNIIASVGNSQPIKMDFGSEGRCEAYVKDAGDSQDANGVIYKNVKVECTGYYENNSFKLTRFLKLKQSGSLQNNELKTCAYLHYGDGDMYIDGGIEGDIIIMGKGHLSNAKANDDHHMYNVTCANELEVYNSACEYDVVAIGKYLVLGETKVHKEVYVGADKRDENDADTGELNDDIYCYLHGSKLESILRCEGVTIIGGDASINDSNAKRDASGNIIQGDGAAGKGANNPDQNAILSGGDLYLGYNIQGENFSGYHTGDSYKNPASTVNTMAGLTGGDSASQRIYGSVVSGGDVYIASTAEIFGDITCKGDLTISANCVIHGKIYAGGNVHITGSVNASLSQVFPDSRIIQAGGTVTMDSPNIHKSDFGTDYENLSAVPDYSVYFNGTDFVQAAAYFKDKYNSAPKPTTNIPTGLYSLPETRQTSDPQVVEKQYLCNWCDEMVRDMTQLCTGNNCPQTDENKSLGYWVWDDVSNPWWPHWEHKQHMGLNQHQPHMKSYDPPQFETVINSVDQMHITSNARLVGDFNFTASNQKLYIDTSPQPGDGENPATPGNNIDILLQGNITLDNEGGIFVNDYGGQYQIRIFMTEGSSIRMNYGNGGAHKGIYVISDADKDIDMSALPSNANANCIDVTKIPQLYFFGQEGINNITLDVGNYGYIPGYVLMPFVDVEAGSNAHVYTTGSTVGHDVNNPSQKTDVNYPFFYGMLMCNSLTFNEGTNTFIKYDWRLDETVEDADGVMQKSEARKKFDSALSRDAVMTFVNSSGDSSGGTGGTPTVQWNVESCY